MLMIGLTATWVIYSPTDTLLKQGGIGVGSRAQKPAISPKRCKIGRRLLWRTNIKSHKLCAFD